MYIIYQVSGPEGKLYIGYTKFSEKLRWQRHLIASRESKKNYHFYNAIRKYGAPSFRIFRLATIKTLEEAKELERLYIRLLRANDPDFGYNSTSGAEGIIYTEEVRQKMRTKSKQVWSDPEYRKKISESRKGDKAHFYGKKHSQESKNKISEAIAAWHKNRHTDLSI